MVNKSKCKICEEIIEAVENSIIECRCGELTLDGIKRVVICKSDVKNYLEVNENDEEVEIKNYTPKSVPEREELIDMLDDMRKSYDDLPSEAMLSPVNHYDFSSLLTLMLAISKSKQ